MLSFVIDEDLSRSISKMLQEKGWTVYDIRDHNLRGAKDEEIFQFAQQQKAVLLPVTRALAM